MKKKFKVEIYKNGTHLNEMINIVANHNGLKAKVNLDVICGYILALAAETPAKNLKHIFTIPEDDLNSILLSDDNGLTHYLKITECEIFELVDVKDNPVYDNILN